MVVIPSLVGLVPSYPEQLIAWRRPSLYTSGPPAWDTLPASQVPPIRRTGWTSSGVMSLAEPPEVSRRRVTGHMSYGTPP